MLVFFVQLLSAAAVQDWTAIDARSRSMGNAGVSASEGPVSGYWNPANLARGDDGIFDFDRARFGFSLYAGAQSLLQGTFLQRLNGLANESNQLGFSNAATQVANGSATPADVQTVLTILNQISRLDEGVNGVVVTSAGGLDFRFGPIGVFARNLLYGGVQPIVNLKDDVALADSLALASDLAGLPTPGPGALSPQGQSLSASLVAAGLSPADADKLAFQSQQALGNAAIATPAFQNALSAAVRASLAGLSTLSANSSGFTARAMGFIEAGASLALPIIPHRWTAGIALKYVYAETTEEHVSLVGVANEPNALPVLRENMKSHDRTQDFFNLDLGTSLLVLPGLTVGVTARNLIPVTLTFADGEDVRLHPLVRGGLSWAPLHWLTIAVDGDFTRNEYQVTPGFFSQTVGGGVEFDLTYVQLRAGAFGNLATPEQGPIPTAGLGLKFFGVTMDLGLQFYPKYEQIRDTSSGGGSKLLPEQIDASFTLSAEFRF